MCHSVTLRASLVLIHVISRESSTAIALRVKITLIIVCEVKCHALKTEMEQTEVDNQLLMSIHSGSIDCKGQCYAACNIVC